MPYVTRRIWNPAMYQGGATKRRYFEGWYFKHVDGPELRTIAVIPGVAYAADGVSAHAFVQFVPAGGETRYFAYPVDAFSFDPSAPFSIRIADNTFSCDGIALDLEDEKGTVKGELRFGPWSPWPVTPLSPGIMGWYRFVPRMETYHGVLSMDHTLSGSIRFGRETVSFDGGRGYAEKDWGRSFPSSWIWAQSNNFGAEQVSLTLSVGKVPWLTSSFVGTIAGLLLEGSLHRFATYTGAKLACIETGVNEAVVVLRDRREELEIHVHGLETLILKAPLLGAMDGKDAESLGGTVDVVLRSLRGGRATVLFAGTGRQAGVEVTNDADELGRIPCEPGPVDQ